MDDIRPAPARPTSNRRRTMLSMIIAFALTLGLMPLSMQPSPAIAAPDGSDVVTVTLHFKDAAYETVDFATYAATCVEKGDALYVKVNTDPDELSFDERLSFAVYEHYATFGNKQRDITEECSYDAATGIVAIPSGYRTNLDTLGIVFELSPTHPAYEHYVTADLDTSDLTVNFHGSDITFQSDVSDVVEAAEQADKQPLKALRAAAFPGESGKRYQLSEYTRLENFDVDQRNKQYAYGFPEDMLGSYGFGAMFGTHQDYKNGVSTGTEWKSTVLKASHSSYDADVEAFFAETIAARLGDETTFAISRSGDTYRDRYLTRGGTFQDPGYGPGEAPTNKALAHATCGSAGVTNGSGALMANHDGDNYIVYKGTYNGAQSKYKGWCKFYYKFDAKSASTGQTFQDVVGYLLIAPPNTGAAQVVKESANTAITASNDRYSFKNAVFAAFAKKADAKAALAKAQAGAWETWREARDWAREAADFVFTTKEDGKSSVVEDIEAGSYYVVELFAPKGYRLSSAIEPLAIEPNSDKDNPHVVTFADEPETGSIDLLKRSDNPGLTAGNPCYRLEGATYGVYEDAACTALYDTMRTSLDENEDGYARLDRMPLGSYWVKELERPLKGYGIDPTVYPVTVSADKIARVGGSAVSDPAKLNPIDIFLQKKDAQSGSGQPQGGASLGDAHYRINYYDIENASSDALAQRTPRASWVVRTDDTGSFSLANAEGSFTHVDASGKQTELPYKVSGPDFYKLRDGRLSMPLGTYTVQEVKAPEGYRLDDTLHVRHITDDGGTTETVNSFNAEEGGDLVTDQVMRSDLKFLKRVDGGSKLAGIPFKLTSKTTGEWHVIVTDKNGLASTESTTSRPHSANTNGNDAQFRAEDGSFRMPLVLDTEALDASAGIWFGLGADGTSVAVNDGMGALPFDTYELEELRCPANAIFQMIRDEIIVGQSDDAITIDLGTLNNSIVGKPVIATDAYDGISGNLYDSDINADSETAIIDRVTYSGLEPGAPYQIEAILMDKATAEPFLVNGETVTNTVEFSPEDDHGYVNVPLAFDASGITTATDLVVFETLRRGDVEEASHRDINDLRQTVTVNPIAIKTLAKDSVSGTNEGVPAEQVTIIDTVTYQGLTPGFEYRMVATLMNKATGEAVAVDDQVVSVEQTFTPEEPSGSIDMEITIPGLDLEGVSLVVFESLYHNDVEVATHADLNDEGQTVTYGQPDFPLPPTGSYEEPETPQPEESDEPADEEDVEPDEPAEEREPSTYVGRLLAQTGDAAGAIVIGLGILALASLGVIAAARGRHTKHERPHAPTHR